MKITRTYRNAQEIIDIAGAFVQQNSAQIKKALISPKRITNPVIIHTYAETFKKEAERPEGGKYFYLGEAVNKAIGDIMEYNAAEGKSRVASILLIGRYGFDARNLCYSKEFNYDEKSGKVYSAQYGKQVKLQFLTAHSSKGLSADNVIIINADKVKMTGNKWTDKVYLSYTGYPGGQREMTPARLQAKPNGDDRLLRKVVKGMLPKNKLGAKLLSNMYVYAGSEHKHDAQNPKSIDINLLK